MGGVLMQVESKPFLKIKWRRLKVFSIFSCLIKSIFNMDCNGNIYNIGMGFRVEYNPT